MLHSRSSDTIFSTISFANGGDFNFHPHLNLANVKQAVKRLLP